MLCAANEMSVCVPCVCCYCCCCDDEKAEPSQKFERTNTQLEAKSELRQKRARD